MVVVEREPGVEIERKFLVGRVPSEIGAGGDRIRQGYLATGPDGREVRVRDRAGRAYLTIKQGAGRRRVEEEIEIDQPRFGRLWPLTEGARLEKVRHVIELSDGLAAELDIYQGELGGLATVEVEFASERDSESFLPPDWFGQEITEDERFRNRQLAEQGLPRELG